MVGDMPYTALSGTRTSITCMMAMPQNNCEYIKSSSNPRDYDWKHLIDILLYIPSNIWPSKRVKNRVNVLVAEHGM